MEMTDLIALAKQAGAQVFGDAMRPDRAVASFFLDQLQAFADLIRQSEREACAVLCDSFQYHPVHQTPENCAEAIRARTTT